MKSKTGKMYCGDRNQKIVALGVRMDREGNIDRKGRKGTSWVGENVLSVVVDGGYMGLFKTH